MFLFYFLVRLNLLWWLLAYSSLDWRSKLGIYIKMLQVLIFLQFFMNLNFWVEFRLFRSYRWSWLGHKWRRIIKRLAVKFLIPAGYEDLILLVDVFKHTHLTVP